MVFSSVVFLFYFFPVVLFFYFISGKSARNIVLLLASIIFYAWGEPHFVIVLLISIMINYVIGILIEKLQMKSYKKIILLFGLIANLGILFYFKYVNFFIQIINDIISRLMINFRIHTIDIALPIGLSFFIFQEISYIIDVYRGDVPAQNKIISLALYISMFPQLIAGPIVRYSDVYKEIDSRSSSIDDVYYGLRRFIMGLGEKVIIADILANEVKLIFENVQLSMGGVTPLVAWIGATAYTFQIYFDFCGYSNMAVGMARIFGFHLSDNFRLPYMSTSISEFWRRWHISLGSWFKDYLYIPLGGNRKGNTYRNLLIVFLCTGLWHGAAWAYVFWGLWHGFFIIIEKLAGFYKFNFPKLIRWLYTMLIVMIGWIFFGIEDLWLGFEYIKVMFGKYPVGFQLYNIYYYIDWQIIITLIVAFLLSMGIPQSIFHQLVAKKKIHIWQNMLMDIGLLVMLVYSIIMIVNGNFSPFIYFRF